MEIYREITIELEKWKKSENRRPLIIQGARQIGKTWVMKKFGEEHYRHTAYFNFEASKELCLEFGKTKDPARIISILGIYNSNPINAEDTLIIFDEIQECPDALNSLKYFCEEAPEYHIMAAGSLLGVAIHRHKGFPVGKVDFLHMYPITFREYLRAENGSLVDYIESIDSIQPLPEIISGKLWEAFRKYEICGGMPKAAVTSIENKGNEAINKEQEDILTSYYFDFSKHTTPVEFPRIAAVWQSLPSQLAKENRKFVYKVVKPGARAREYENAISWLREAGLVYQIFCTSKPGLPLSAFDDLNAFKLYLLDIGLLRSLAKLPPEIFTNSNPLFSEFKGALTENMVAQALAAQLIQQPRYWVSNGTAEIDFLIQEGLSILPVEVKSSANTAGKSLSVYIGKYSPETAIIFSGKELSTTIGKDTTTKILNIPLPLIDWLPRFIKMI
ncbi:MAG: ATP-binding protein [Muribaculaceae bacterium]|nr:ATP-binding protein [Muribaculaceae bacterium]